jgi:aminopeptidase YwaD
MNPHTYIFDRRSLVILVLFILASGAFAYPGNMGFLRHVTGQPPAQAVPARPNTALKTPLPQDLLTLLSNEVSGQIAFNNMIRLAGAPWVRDPGEFKGTMEETQKLYDTVRSYGIETVKIERYPGTATTDYPLEGEFWMLAPEKRLIGRLAADAALIMRGSSTSDITGDLVYLPPMTADEIKAMKEAGVQEKYQGKLALVWSGGSDQLQALDLAGFAGIVTFAAQDRHLDPDQVLYSSASFEGMKNLRIGVAISGRQWSELMELVEGNRKVTVRAKARVEKLPDKFEGVYAWIPGAEPEKKGVIYTGHLFEGFIKRGANDDMSGVVVELEILRTLHRLIASGELPRPRRTLHFLWINEISGTYEFIKQHPALAGQWSININMDMVGEALRKNNSLFTMSECPGHLPSYLDALADSFLNYVWRTNDIVYLPDAPRGLYRGQYFPSPMWEKNGSRDAFRYFIHRATGGSDHICFVNPAVAVPGIEFFTWPDQWYHTDTDTPDKADATEMKRVAFVGAAAGWAAASCDDGIAGALADAVSQYGYRRIAAREIPKAMSRIDEASAKTLTSETGQALNLVRFGVKREIGALRTIDEISSSSAAAAAAVADRVRQWEVYGKGLKAQVLDCAATRAKRLGIAAQVEPPADSLRAKYARIAPTIAPEARYKEFTLARFEPYAKYVKEHPDALKTIALSASQTGAVLNFVNGRNSIAEIRDDAAAELDADLPLQAVAAYIELLAAAGYVKF